jgi:hypothetical protein
MNARVRQAALRIALLREEFTEVELREAVYWLEAQGSTSALLRYLVGRDLPKPDPSAQIVPTNDMLPTTVLALKQTEPQKYEAIVHFLQLAQDKDVKLSHLRRLGTRLRKDFRGTGSRRGVLVELAQLLEQLPVVDIQRIANEIPCGLGSEEGDYQRLARHIIDGVGQHGET